ncbi:MAG: hypothetical protein HY007_02060 [Candidatus Sungbacteria bacterium]|nr:hypothetical protein [Candidatus Sungbacteria bacterium]
MTTIEKTELHDIMAQYQGNELFAEVLRQAETPERLVPLLANYLGFNVIGATGAGPTSVAAEVAMRRDIFQDPDEILDDFSDRSAEIAKDIFFAAIDELSDITHRLLALATLKGCMRFFGFTPEDARMSSKITPATRMIMERIKDGYGIGRTLDDLDLFEAIGFHLGSEWSADPEFKNLATALEHIYPLLVDYLKDTSIEISGRRYECYPWIGDHTRVEEEHADKARRAANTALRYFTGDSLRAKEAILNGARNFFSIQTDFALSLCIVEPFLNW